MTFKSITKHSNAKPKVISNQTTQMKKAGEDIWVPANYQGVNDNDLQQCLENLLSCSGGMFATSYNRKLIFSFPISL